MYCALLASAVVLYVVGFGSVICYLDNQGFGEGEMLFGAFIWPYTAYRGDLLRVLMRNLNRGWRDFFKRLTEQE